MAKKQQYVGAKTGSKARKDVVAEKPARFKRVTQKPPIGVLQVEQGLHEPTATAYLLNHTDI